MSFSRMWTPCQQTPVLALTVVAVATCSGATRESAPAAHALYVAADVRFMEQMIVHHMQALEMTRLVPPRTGREVIRLLAQRIETSQLNEIERMRRWLRERGEREPEPDAAAAYARGGAHAAHMPGMASVEELERLAAASGAEFDHLFLELMIRHHEGALAMVAELFAADGAAHDPEVFQFASHVDADQRAEIARMRGLQAAPGQRGRA